MNPTKKRLTWVMLFCIGGAVLILGRASYIQLAKNPRLDSMARRQFHSRSLIRPRRGNVFDRNGEPLAINIDTKSLAANPGKAPSKLKDRKRLARRLASIAHVPYSKILLKLNSKKEFVWIKRHLTEVELRKIRKLGLIDSDGELTAGLWLVNESERVYPHKQLASHLIGSVNVDSEGLEGIELLLNDRLRGEVVSVSAIKDGLGRSTFIDEEAAKSVHDGESVNLTIDASLQFEVEQELAQAVKKTGAKGGAVIVMSASNGEILAMANEPTFDPNEKGVSPDRRRNRALTDGYEPGSTFKAVLLASALSNHWKLTDEVWAEKGSLTIQGHRISEAESREKFEWLSLKRLIQVSSNVAAAKVALKLGPDAYLKTIRSFGFGSKTGIQFPGEISGRVPARKEWMPLTLANIGFGHGILVTPLQMTRAYAAVLNGGWLLQPTLMKGQKDLIGTEVSPVRIFSSQVAEDVVAALETVTDVGGTGTEATLAGYRIAGKTGTAQMIDPVSGKYSHDRYISTFIGFVVDVNPKIVVFAGLVEPQGVYYASKTAAPLFREVIASVANHLSLPKNLDAVKMLADQKANEIKDQVKLPQAAPVNPTSADYRLRWKEDKENPKDAGWVTPSLTGLTPREVIQVLRGHHFGIQISGNGIVASQKPEPGARISEGETLRFVLSEP